MTKLLNLDDIKTEKEVQLGGRKRRVRSMTVDQFINASDVQETIKGAKGVDQIKLMVAHITEYLDETTEDELRKLSFEQLMALSTFIRGTDMQPKADAAANPPVGQETAASK